MDYLNAVYVNAGETIINCEIEHPQLGWIPYTLNPDDTDQTVDNVMLLAAMETGSDVAAYVVPEVPDPTSTDVNAERDRRMNGSFTFNGSEFQCDAVSLSRITGAATLAGFAMGAGAQAGDVRWHGGTADFVWIDANNNFVSLDAPSMFAVGQAAAANESAHVFAAFSIRAIDPIPDDFADDSRWP